MLKTVSETVFEAFLRANEIPFEAVATTINEPGASRPDYIVDLADQQVCCEIKELAPQPGSDAAPGIIKVRGSIIGDRIRRLIKRAKDQVRYGAERGYPTLLVIYNNDDPLQLFGTGPDDFMSAMYGSYTIQIGLKSGKASPIYFGGQKSLTNEMNTSFSGLAHLSDRNGVADLEIYENCFAKIPLAYEALPDCITATRFEPQLVAGMM